MMTYMQLHIRMKLDCVLARKRQDFEQRKTWTFKKLHE